MEAYRDLPLTEALLHRLLLEPSFSQVPLGLAVQAYLPEAQFLIQRLVRSSALRVQAGGVPLRVRLVKGANLHMERVEASMHRLEVPIFPSKPAVDANFKRTLRACLLDLERGNLRLGVGTHNLFEMAYAALLRRRRKLEHALHFEMLEGMAGPVGRVICRTEGQLLIYAPAVEEQHFSSAVSYLVRRLDENTAPENFLKVAPEMEPGDVVFQKQADAFLSSLAKSNEPSPRTFRVQSRAQAGEGTGDERHQWSRAFDNASETDFTREDNRVWLHKHRRKVLETAGEIVVRPLVSFAEPSVHSSCEGFDPSRPSFSYRIDWATKSTVERAIAAAQDALSAWNARTKEERGRIVFSVGDALERKRGELLAAMALDAGKRVVEADVEISEAVDFARYYAKVGAQLPDSTAPLGVVAVVSPWNFPLAIPLGGVFAALVAGNTVVLKPAPETPWVASLAASVCHEAGIPREVLQFVPCRNEDAGPVLEDGIAAVVLTGATSTAQHFVRTRPRLRLFAETGGKNAAYVSPSADRELAVGHIVQSAFGHSGQKCSALSVLILHQELFDDEQFRQSLLDATRSLPVGSAWDLGSRITPLIRPPTGALHHVLNEGEKYGEWLLRPERSPSNPRLLSPGLLWGVEAGSYPHQTELFGPILSVVRAASFDEALEILNRTPYGLTAGLFSLSESEQELFANRAEVGNVYINRGLTGAVVARQPFGGRKASCFGPGAKAGSAGYVLQLTREDESAWEYTRRVKDYMLAKATNVSQIELGTRVLGEENYLRCIPGRTALVVGHGVEREELKATLLARRLSECRLPIIVMQNVMELLDEDLFHRDRHNVLVVPTPQLAARCVSMRVERVRVVGTLPEELLVSLVEAKVSAVGAPVANSGVRELSYYLATQSISFASHRYGNTKMGSLARLRDALKIWS